MKGNEKNNRDRTRDRIDRSRNLYLCGSKSETSSERCSLGNGTWTGSRF